MRYLLRLFFHLLYHQFAFAYDFVSAVVSFGHWKDWIMEVLPFIRGTRILEIGYGPGHLQRILLDRNLVAVGIDESHQMARLAKRRLTRLGSCFLFCGWFGNYISYFGYTQVNLTRGRAQFLPFQNETFDTIIATFPSEYILEQQTLSEARRCLSNGGRFIVLPVALPKSPLLAWLFKVTQQAPREALKIVQEKWKEPFLASHFEVQVEILETQSGYLLIVIASKPSEQA